VQILPAQQSPKQPPNNTTMQNQIMNQLLLFGIQPGEYQITTHPAGETEITVGGNTVAIIPMIGRKAIQLNREWTLDRIPGDSVILAVSAVVAALLHCRHTAAPRPQIALPAPRLWCAACGKWGDHGSGSCTTIQVSPRLGAMVDKTPSLRGGEAAITKLGIYTTDNHSPEEYE
jgi:hypothetical protein